MKTQAECLRSMLIELEKSWQGKRKQPVYYTNKHTLESLLADAEGTKVATMANEAVEKPKRSRPKKVKPEQEQPTATPSNGKKEGLRKKQVQFLRALADAGSPLTRPALCVAASAHPTNVTANALGYVGVEARAKREAIIGYPSLLTLGYVRVKEMDSDGEKQQVYELTAAGRKALEKANRASS